MTQKTIETGVQYRTAEFDRASADQDSRTIELSFSSETPVERWFGLEILGHKRGEVDLGWVGSGRAPLLADHNHRDQVGVVEKANLGTGRVARAVVRFGKSDRAEELFQDVLDGIRSNVSVGYQINEMKLEKSSSDGPDTYRATSWTPLEVSLVSVPADTAVGVGRNDDSRKITTTIIDERNIDMTTNDIEPRAADTKPAAPAAPHPQVDLDTERSRAKAEGEERGRADGAKAERERIAEISEYGRRHNLQALAAEHVREGTSVEQFRGLLIEKIGDAKPLDTPDTDIGMERKEVKSYSMLKAMRAMSNKNDWTGAELELEASNEIAKRTGRDPQGFFVPLDVAGDRSIPVELAQDGSIRVLAAGTPSAGGYSVGVEMMSMIELLRNRMMVRQMGARVMSGLVGDVEFPKHTGSGQMYWGGEDEDTTESTQTLGDVTLSPKSASAFTRYSRRMLLQSSMDVEAFVRDDLATVIALGIDLAAINGSGVGSEPRGILNMTGTGSVSHGTDGGAPTWATVVEHETDVSVANADVGTMGYLTNASVRGKMKTVEKASSTGQFLWGDSPSEPGIGSLNGYRAGVSNQVPRDLTKGSGTNLSAMIFGNFGSLLIGEWGVFDVLVNPYTEDTKRRVRVTVYQDVDVAVRHAQAFSHSKDIVTA
tara:strand:+ start:2110 stop:4077 length:1968 start_codon:yes stop_codon:yes gene_type:complete